MFYLYRVEVGRHEYIGCAVDVNGIYDEHFKECDWVGSHVHEEDRKNDLKHCVQIVEVMIDEQHDAWYVIKSERYDYEDNYFRTMKAATR